MLCTMVVTQLPTAALLLLPAEVGGDVRAPLMPSAALHGHRAREAWPSRDRESFSRAFCEQT